MMETVLKLVTEIHKDVREVDRKLTAHIEDETTSATTLIKEMREHAFVNGDTAQHKQMQQLAIDKAEEGNALIRDLRKALAKAGVIGFIGFAIYALWKALLEGPR